MGCCTECTMASKRQWWNWLLMILTWPLFLGFFISEAVKRRRIKPCDPGGHLVGRLVRQPDGGYRWHGAY